MMCIEIVITKMKPNKNFKIGNIKIEAKRAFIVAEV